MCDAVSMKPKMDESCWWSSTIPASKRASHVIIIGFLCVTLAAGLSDDGGLQTRREHADTRQQHQNQQQLHTISATIRDADNSVLLHNLLATKNSASISTDSSATGHKSSSLSNNIINQIKVSNITSSSSTISKLTASVLSRLNSSPPSSSSGSNRTERGERLHSWSPMSSDSTLEHHLRTGSQADAEPSRRVRRKASSRGSTLIYNSKQPTQLFCRTNFRLAVHEDGTINGTRDNMDVYCKYTLLILFSEYTMYLMLSSTSYKNSRNIETSKHS